MTPDTPRVPVLVSAAKPLTLEIDWLIVPTAESDQQDVIEAYDRAVNGELARAFASGEFKAKPYELFVTPVTSPGWRVRRLVLVGLGPSEQADAERLRRATIAATLAARSRNVASLGVLCRAGEEPPRDAQAAAQLARAAAEGVIFALFDAGRYKTIDHESWRPQTLVVALPGASDGVVQACRTAVDTGVVVAECANWARELANEPGNRLRPEAFARRAADLAIGHGLDVDILDDRRLADLHMELLLGVGQGSEEPPRMLVLRYTPVGASPRQVLGLVGKGVTFDTGGISIKPSQGMERMKDDMAGGATVVAAMCAVARLRGPIPVVGIVPIAENMPSGQAIRPGDVLQSASGKTVEVLDTDAEGRLILADALWYARSLGATHVVDVATLTGACMVALGTVTSGLFGRPQPWVDTIRRTAAAAGDRVWELPLFDDYREQLRSDIADLKNVGGRPAGAITAAMFLSEFAGDGAWAHLDIAGTAWADEGKPYLPKGPTGVAVRTLAALAFATLP